MRMENKELQEVVDVILQALLEMEERLNKKFDEIDTEEIEDLDYRAYVEDSCCEEFMMERLSETYNMWSSWWVEGDEDEDGNEIPPDKTNNPGYITYRRALELLDNAIKCCTNNGNVELEIARRDLDAIGFSDDEIKWFGYDWILEEEN